jgi:cytochrome c peroxidase
MPSKSKFVLCLALLLQSTLPAECNAQPTASDFTRDALLQRFDRDNDERLTLAERSELRKAFGEIDVPMLPTETSKYSLGKRPIHISQATLDELDNREGKRRLNDRVATLGKVLFYDTNLSLNDTVSCASCHHQDQGFSDPRQFSVGFAGGKTKRNAMGLGYVRFTNINGAKPGFFWDERAATLEAQILMPIQDPIEMGMELESLERKLQKLAYYPPLFDAAFQSRNVTADKIARAIAEFMQSMATFDSRFDRAAINAGTTDYSVNFSEFSAQENLGKALFIEGVDGVGEMGCAHCHVPPSFGMSKSLNNGLQLDYADPGLGGRDVPPNDPFTPDNKGKFKAPSLRNIARTAPYMHDGRFKTLDRIVDHYSNGVHPHKNLGLVVKDSEAETSGFQLTPEQKLAIVAFLHTLTDSELASDPRFSDPFVRLQQ